MSLTSLFDEMVESPAAPPPSIEELEMRSRRRRIRRVGGVGGAALVTVLVLVAASSLGSDDATRLKVAGDGARELTYLSTSDAGFRASGSWSIRIERDGRTVEFGPASGPCRDRGAIRKGDRVEAQIHDGRSYVEIGPGVGC